MGQADEHHHSRTQAGGIDRPGHAHVHQDHEDVVEDHVDGVAGDESHGGQLGVVVAVDEVIERPLAEHDRHQHQLGTHQLLTVLPHLGARGACPQEGEHLGQEDQAQDAQDDVDAQHRAQGVGKDVVAVLLAPFAQGVGVIDGPPDGQGVANGVKEHIDRLANADGGQAHGADGIADKDAVGQAANGDAQTGQQARQKKAVKGFPDEHILPGRSF